LQQAIDYCQYEDLFELSIMEYLNVVWDQEKILSRQQREFITKKNFDSTSNQKVQVAAQINWDQNLHKGW